MRNRNHYPHKARPYREHNPRNRVFFGILLAFLGVGLMLKTLGLFDLDLEFSWPVILIAIGILLGIKNGGRNNAWWILIIVGAANMIPQFTIMGKASRHFVWPLIMIGAGIMIALRPRRERKECYPGMANSIVNTEGNLNIDVTFGGRKEVVTSKDFKGGTVSVTFGGTELNLTQADFASPTVIIDFRIAFGSVEMIVPSHWEIQNEVNPSFGSVEDERTIQTGIGGEVKKVLILRGSCSFGSIEIKSY
jgi:predicted membrane protein